MKFLPIALLAAGLPAASAFSSIASPLPAFPSLGDAFKIVKQPCDDCSAVVVEADVAQDGVSCYIALDSDSYGHTARPGNGGIRLLNYDSAESAIDDAVRLAKGMTRKHDMFRTGFSGAKVSCVLRIANATMYNIIFFVHEMCSSYKPRRFAGGRKKRPRGPVPD